MTSQQLTEAEIKNAVSWFSSKIKDLFGAKKDSGDVSTAKELQNDLRFFHLYTTVYSNPKYKEELPFYDAVPLFFPVDIVKGSEGLLIRGINIHYLMPSDRVKFLNELKKVIIKAAQQQNFDPEHLEDYPAANISKVIGKYMNNVYRSGGGSAGSVIRSAYRSYFLGRIGARLKKIPLGEWEQAGRLILPVFRKQSSGEIYKSVYESYDKYKSNFRSPLI